MKEVHELGGDDFLAKNPKLIQRFNPLIASNDTSLNELQEMLRIAIEEKRTEEDLDFRAPDRRMPESSDNPSDATVYE